MRIVIVLLAACFLLGAAIPSFAGPALDTVKGKVDEVIKVLNNPAYQR